MDVRHINPFVQATSHVLSTMLKVTPQMREPHLKDEGARLPALYQVAASIALTGGVTGLFVLALPKPAALSLASALAGEEMKELNADCCDALGELANMIAGNAKKSLAPNVKISLPAVAHPTKINYPPNQPVLVIPFDTPAARFIVEVSISRAAASAPAAEPASV